MVEKLYVVRIAKKPDEIEEHDSRAAAMAAARWWRSRQPQAVIEIIEEGGQANGL